MIQKFYAPLILVALFLSCSERANDQPNNPFSDPSIQKIYDLQDRRLSDSLYQFLASERPDYRRQAALAFGSIQDSLAVEHLARLLMREKDSTVRMATAFSIGQINSTKSERIILGALMKEKDPFVLRELLEAYGKTTSHWQLIKPSFFHDTIQSEGVAWSIYRAGLNGKTDSTANRVASNLLSLRYNNSTRLGAAHFFSRSGLHLEPFFEILKESATKDPSVEVRMAAASALRKVGSPAALETLKNIISGNDDYRVKVNAIRALQSFDFEATKSVLYNLLYEKNVHVAITASEVVKALATNDNWIELSNITGRIQHWRVQANLYDAALKATDNKTVVDEVRTTYKQSINVYQKAAILTALQNNLQSFDFLRDELFKADTAVIRTAAASALAGQNYHKGFTPALRKKFAALVKEALQLGIPAVTGALSSPLADPKLGYREIVNDISFLKEARRKLVLPKDIEAVEALEAAIAYFEEREVKKGTPDFQHPIDWAFVQTIPVDQQVVVKTSRGHITLRLLVNESPGSVANFLQLAERNYFDKQSVHRVVSNFVVQSGCNLGDGSGGEGHAIRSEFSHRRYSTGSVGMASAGKDTEGTQWFITHSPTPHLDGRYTIFAEVVKGQEVVDLLEVGDQIHDVEILR